jgi:hypothetical protein
MEGKQLQQKKAAPTNKGAAHPHGHPQAALGMLPSRALSSTQGHSSYQDVPETQQKQQKKGRKTANDNPEI